MAMIMSLGMKDELHRNQCKKFGDSELKDVMYNAKDIIDLHRIIESTLLLADQNLESRASSVRCFSDFTSVPLRHEIGNRIKEINERLEQKLMMHGRLKSFLFLMSSAGLCSLVLKIYHHISSSIFNTSLHRPKIAQLWVSKGFVTEHKRKSMEQLAEGYFDELAKSNLMLRHSISKDTCKLHDLIRSLAIFLSQDESSFGDSNLRNFNTTIKLRRLSVQYQKNAT